jgi:lipopolysaccharide transport system permease protein
MEPVIYEPNKYLKLGIRIWPEMFRELAESRELVWQFFVRDLCAKNKQSVLGYLWVLIMPFVTIGVFMFLNRAGILRIGATDVPYPLFALIGLSVWQIFATGIVSGTNSIVSAGSLISKINFPREVLVFASMAQTVFEFMTKVFLVALFFAVFHFVPSWKIVFFPFAVVPILILTLGLSLFLSLLNGVVRDTANVVSLLATFLLFLTPVLYPAPDTGVYFRLNPLTALVNAPRDIVIYGHIREPMDFLIAAVFSCLVFLVSWRVFHLVETRIPERM